MQAPETRLCSRGRSQTATAPAASTTETTGTATWAQSLFMLSRSSAHHTSMLPMAAITVSQRVRVMRVWSRSGDGGVRWGGGTA